MAVLPQHVAEAVIYDVLYHLPVHVRNDLDGAHLVRAEQVVRPLALCVASRLEGHAALAVRLVV